MVRADQFGLGLSGVGNRRRNLFASAAAVSSTVLSPQTPIGTARLPYCDASFGSFRSGGKIQPYEGDSGGVPLAVLPWRFLALLEIVNFAPLRRHLGAPRADCLVQDVANRVAEQQPEARLAVVGRTTIEVAFEGDDLSDLTNALDTIVKLFAAPIDLDGEPHRIELAIGAAAAETSASDEVRLVEEAEEALAQARNAQHPVIRDLTAGTQGFDRFSLVRDLSTALSRGEIFLP